MNKLFLILLSILLLMALNLPVGCSKDKDKVNELEQEAMDATAVKTAPDTGAYKDTQMVAEKPAEKYKDELSNRQYNSPGSGGFTVQIGSGTSREEANYMADKFIKWGYEAFVTEVYIDDVSHYRIRVGNMATYQEAESLGKELHDKYSVDYWIDNNI